MGNTVNICQGSIPQQKENEVKFDSPTLQPILFTRPDQTPPQPVNSERQSQIHQQETPAKINNQQGKSNFSTISKCSPCKISSINLRDMIVIVQEGQPREKHLDQVLGDMVAVPFQIVKLTITPELELTFKELGSQLLFKYANKQRSGSEWKLHPKGYYINYLAHDLSAIFTTNTYYEGEIRQRGEESLPHGEGILLSNDGMYSGSFIDGKANGNGSYVDRTTKTSYKGTWSQGQLVSGTIDSESFKFKGQLQEGLAHGEGVLHFKNIDAHYKGGFDKGLFNGEGLLTTKDNIYDGGFINGHKQGIGSLELKERNTNTKDKKKSYRPSQKFSGKWEADCFKGKLTQNKTSSTSKSKSVNK